MFLLLHIYTFHKSSREQEAKDEALLHVASQIGCFSSKQSRKTKGQTTEGNRHTHLENLMTRPNVKAKTTCTSLVPSVRVLRLVEKSLQRGPAADQSGITKRVKKKPHILIPRWNNPSMVSYLGKKDEGSVRFHCKWAWKNKSSGRRSLDWVDRS